MSKYGILDNVYKKSTGGESGRTYFDQITIGFVVDTNDPQQMGRVRARCPSLNDPGDTAEYTLEDIPWAMYCSPFGGSVSDVPRGPEDDITPGEVAYGMWNIPKVGSQVLVMCLDGNPQQRIYIGCVHGQFLPHTLPHGRYNNDEVGTLDGPLSSTEDQIQPLYKNQTTAFNDKRTSPEWRTRGADFAATALDPGMVSNAISDKSDDKDIASTELDGNEVVHRQGYTTDRFNAERVFKTTTGRYDNQISSWTTPGFHSIAMDDRAENCRMRMRTTSGHQIILDDTNERIYISTAEGKNWIEMDQRGNIDLFSESRVSIHAADDINLTSKQDIRMSAENIHMYSNAETRIQSADDISVSGDNLRFKAESGLYAESGSSMHFNSSGDLISTSVGMCNIKSGSILSLDAAGIMNLLAAGNVLVTGALVHLNGPPATPAIPASSPDEIQSNQPSRVPQSEPWARTIMKKDGDVTSTGSSSSQTPEYTNVDADSNKIEDGQSLGRNPNWHR